MLTWKNDHLLLDSRITANKLIKQGNEDLLLLDKNKSILNLYSALVKKEDFIKTSDYYTFLKKTPFVSIEPKLLKASIKFSQNPYTEITNKLYEYTKFQIKSRFAKTKSKIKRMIEKGEISIVILRIIAKLFEEYKISDEREILSKFFKNVKYVWAQNVPKVKLPITLKELTSEHLIYFTGAVAGDGCLMVNRNYISVSDGCPNKSELFYSYNYLYFLKKIIEQTFKNSLSKKAIGKKEGNYYTLQLTNKIIHRFLNYFFSIPLGVKYSKLDRPRIFQLLPSERKKRAEAIYWRGVADTDGNIHRNRVRIGSKNKKFMLELLIFFQKIGIKASFYTAKTQYLVIVHFYDLLKYAQLIGFNHPRKRKYLIQKLKNNPNKRIFFGLIKDNLTPDGYFDFLKIKGSRPNDLKVCNVGHILKKFRNRLGLTQHEIKKKFKVSSATVSLWEQNKRSIPFLVLSELSKSIGVNVYHFLEKEKGLKWKFCNSPNEVKLPLKPNSNFNEIVKCLSPIFSPRKYAKKTYIVRGFGTSRLTKKKFKKILKKVKETFGLEIKHNKRVNYYVHNRALQRFLLTFYNYKLPWKAINKNIEKKILKSWELR